MIKENNIIVNSIITNLQTYKSLFLINQNPALDNMLQQ